MNAIDSDGEQLLELERAGWEALCAGSGGDFYGSLMTDDGVMVLVSGEMMNRDQVVAALTEAPPWSSYEIVDPQLVPIGRDATALVYVGNAHRSGGDMFTARMVSVYVRQVEGWKLAVYTQTSLEANATDSTSA